MSEEQIIKAIANACGDDTLCFQVIVKDSALHIYINRQDRAEPNYQQLKEKIYTTAIELSPLTFERIWLYCRVLGELEPDWQSVLEVDAVSLTSKQIAPAIESIATAVESANSIVEKIDRELNTTESFIEDFWEIDDLPTTANDSESKTELEVIDSIDLSEYCFIRNKRLLYAVLAAPDESIARLIDTFDWFDSSIQRSQLPILEIYFEQSMLLNVDSFDLEVQTWWAKIEQLDLDSKQMLAIWLSRYCLNAEQTLITIKEVLSDRSDTIEDEIGLEITLPSDSIAQSSPDPMLQPSEVKSGLMDNLRSLLSKLFKSDRLR